MPTQTVILTDQEAALLDSLVASGRFRDADEVLRDGLQVVMHREVSVEDRERAFMAAVAVGEADFAAGRYIEINSPEELHAFMDSLGQD